MKLKDLRIGCTYYIRTDIESRISMFIGSLTSMIDDETASFRIIRIIANNGFIEEGASILSHIFLHEIYPHEDPNDILKELLTKK